MGIPEKVSLVATEDRHVHELFARFRPNANTAPMTLLRKSSGLDPGLLDWLKVARGEFVLTSADDFRGAPGFGSDDGRTRPGNVGFTSPLFLAAATIRGKGESPRRHYWVLRREGKAVRVVHSGHGEGAR